MYKKKDANMSAIAITFINFTRLKDTLKAFDGFKNKLKV